MLLLLLLLLLLLDSSTLSEGGLADAVRRQAPLRLSRVFVAEGTV